MKRYFLSVFLIVGLCSISCTEKPDEPEEEVSPLTPSYSEQTVTHPEIVSVLKEKGISFDASGRILLDDKARSLEFLDLSGKQIDDYSDLAALPELSGLKLSDNQYGPVFDMSILPVQITSVDLTGNEIYEFRNLVEFEEKDGKVQNVKLLHDFSELILPESAKYDCNELPAYFVHDKEVDMKLEEEAYSTLREVPDLATRFILRSAYPSIFSGLKIDISRRLENQDERIQDLVIRKDRIPVGCAADRIGSVEGAEYIIMNPGFLGRRICLDSSEPCTLPYLKLSSTLYYFETHKVNTPHLDMLETKYLMGFQAYENDGIEEVDLKQNQILGQRTPFAETSPESLSLLELVSCNNLKSVTLPPKAAIIYSLAIEDLPLLKVLDLSGLEFIVHLSFSYLPECKISYPCYTESFFRLIGAYFGVTEEFYQKNAETREFLDEYHYWMNLGPTQKGEFFDWTQLYS